ncbi:MAG: hypothetical protein EON54_06205 [Alcaligenaceae bacterium]|nr:MAG: hypothetical protein EON54_06205 [Alcaligenaceae bacterium]
MADLPGSSADEELFKCSCEGENPNCMHCDGSGWTKRAVGLRSASRSLLVRPPKPQNVSATVSQVEPYQTSKEREFARMMSNEMTRLKREFIGQEGDSPVLFYVFLQRLLRAVQPPGNFSLGPFLVRPFEQGGLKGIAEKFGCFTDDPDWWLRTMGRATRECHLAYESALAQKKTLALQQKQQKKKQKQLHARPPKRKNRQPTPNNSAAQNAVPDPQLVQCPHCGKRIYDQDRGQHNRLFHPELKSDKAASKPAKSAKPSVQPPTGRTQTRHTPAQTPTPPQAKKGRLQSDSSKGRARPLQQPTGNLERARADTEPVERRMDARYRWGGSFRDPNGTFGSHPRFDSMDDESDAG